MKVHIEYSVLYLDRHWVVSMKTWDCLIVRKYLSSSFIHVDILTINAFLLKKNAIYALSNVIKKMFKRKVYESTLKKALGWLDSYIDITILS